MVKSSRNKENIVRAVIALELIQSRMSFNYKNSELEERHEKEDYMSAAGSGPMPWKH